MINIIYETPDYVVCVKPVGISAQDDGMGKLLCEQLGGSFYCVHRLDTAVSGLMVYARNNSAAAHFAGNVRDKHYLAVISGDDLEPSGELHDLLFHDRRNNKSYVVRRQRKDVKDARLKYRILETVEDKSLVDVELITGRTHQIRVQFASRKMPLIGDGKYGSKINGNIALFSHRLTIIDPADGLEKTFTARPDNISPWNLFSTIALTDE